jgi:hypothetical protein
LHGNETRYYVERCSKSERAKDACLASRVFSPAPKRGRFRVPTLRIVSGLMNPLFISIYFFSGFVTFEILESLFFSGPFSLVLFFRVFPSRWLRRRGRERERRLCAERRWVKVRTTVLSRYYRLVREYEVARDTRTRGRCRAGRGWKGRKRNHEGTR